MVQEQAKENLQESKCNGMEFPFSSFLLQYQLAG